MEFSSSSSDEELGSALRRNYDRERRADDGITRHARSALEETSNVEERGRLILPNAQTVTVRKGSIYIPRRDLYVHILQARQRPELWFGDGRVPRRHRSTLLPDKIVLYEAVDRGGLSRGMREVLLSEAADNGFFVFKEVKVTSEVSRQRGGGSVEVASLMANLSSLDPLSSVSYQRIVDYNSWREAITYPTQLQKVSQHRFAYSEDGIRMQDICCYDDRFGLIWRFDGYRGSLGCVYFSELLSRMVSAVALNIPFPPQQCVGLKCVREDTEALETNRFCLLVVGTVHVALLSLVFIGTPSPCQTEPLVSLLNMQLLPLHVPAVTCWWSPDIVSLGLPLSFCIGSERSVYQYNSLPQDSGRRQRVASFSKTDVTSITARESMNGGPPKYLVAGMRNGTIQLVAEDGAKVSTTFNTSVRHSGSDITSMYTVPGMEYGFVSVARDGEAKLWDARYLRTVKDPVSTLLSSSPERGQLGCCSVAFHEHLIATSSAEYGAVCVDIPHSRIVFQSKESSLSPTRVFLGKISYFTGYELLVFSPYATERYTLDL